MQQLPPDESGICKMCAKHKIAVELPPGPGSSGPKNEDRLGSHPAAISPRRAFAFVLPRTISRTQARLVGNYVECTPKRRDQWQDEPGIFGAMGRSLVSHVELTLVPNQKLGVSRRFSLRNVSTSSLQPGCSDVFRLFTLPRRKFKGDFSHVIHHQVRGKRPTGL